MMVRFLAGLALAGLLLVCSSCTDAPTNQNPRSLGLSEQPLWEPGSEWRLGDTLLVIGGPGIDDEPFFRIRAATRLRNGHIVVSDDAVGVRVFDSVGANVVELGRTGRGPAEFQRINAISEGAGDTIWLGDGSRGRILAFSSDGDYLDSYQMPEPLMTAASEVIGFLANGDPIVEKRRSQHGVVRAEGLLESDSLDWYVYSRPGDTVHRLATASYRELYGHPWDGALVLGQVIFGAHGYGHVTEDGVVVARGGELMVVERIDMMGVLQTTFGRVTPRRRPSSSDRADYTEYRIAMAPSNADLAAWRRLFRDAPMREFFPAMEDLVIDRTGATWVKHFGLPGDDKPVWSVFDSDGQWLGEIVMPGYFEVLEIGDDYVLGVAEDQLRVETIVLIELSKGEPGGGKA